MKKNIHKINNYIGIIFIILLILCGKEKFLEITNSNISYFSYRIKGFYIVLVGAIIYGYAIATKKKNVFYLSTFLSMIGYGYTFYHVYQVNKTFHSIITYKAGFYLYIITFLLLLINAILYYFLNSNKKVEISDPLLEKNNHSYILANYLLGIKQKPELYYQISVLVLNENILTIFIRYKDEIKIEIPFSSITNVNVKESLSMTKVEPNIFSDEVSNQLLATALIGTWGPVVSKIFLDELATYDTMKYKEIHTIEINYINNNEELKFVFQAKKNPKEFLEKLNEKIKR